MAAGNHEVEFGYESLLNNVKEAKFPILSANVTLNNEVLLKDEDSNGENTIIAVDGPDIGFFSLTLTETSTSIYPSLLGDVKF